MCFCVGKFFKVTKVSTGEFKTYKRASSIAKRFDTNKHNGEYYKVVPNVHSECEQVGREYSIHLSEIPSSLRHLLPVHRQ